MRSTPAIRGTPAAAAAAEPRPLALSVTLTPEDRIAGLMRLYREPIAKQRRNIAAFVAVVTFLTALWQVATSWSEGGRRNPALLWRNFVEALAGPFGLLLAALMIGLLGFLLHGAATRRRLRRWLRLSGLSAPLACRYRVHAGGVDTAEPDCRSHVPARRLRGLAEGPRHVFIAIEGADELIALPRRELSPEQLDDLRGWAGFFWGGQAQTSTEAPPPGPEATGGEALELRFHFAPEDRAAAIIRQQEIYWPRRRRLRGTVLGLVIALLALPAAMLALWAADPHRVPFMVALPLFAEMLVHSFWPVTAALAGLVLLAALVNPWARRRQAKGLAAMLHRRACQDEVRVVVSASGVASSQGGAASFHDWPGFAGIERRGEHIFLLRRRGEPLLLPARVLNSDQMALFDRLTAAHIAATKGTKA